MSSMIVADNVGKEYISQDGSIITALQGASFTVGDGEFVALLGPSGCGKTTLLNIIAGLLQYTAGSLHLRGEKVTGPRREVGLVFQSPTLLPWRTVLENALLPADVMHMRNPETIRRAESLLELVGLGSFRKKHPFELSGGMQQRNAIVRALVHDPAVLLMDEPFGALDAMTRERMGLLTQKIWSETRKTIVLVTHSISEAVFLADRVLIMTPSPGTVAQEVVIPFERPRPPEIMGDPEFAQICQQIRDYFSTLEGGAAGGL